MDIQQMIDAEQERLGRHTIGSTRGHGLTVDTATLIAGLQRAQEAVQRFADAANSNYSSGRLYVVNSHKTYAR